MGATMACPPESCRNFLLISSRAPLVIPMEHRNDTPRSMMKRLALKPPMVLESDWPMHMPKMVTARIATRPTLTFRKKPIRMTATRTIREMSARLFMGSIPPVDVFSAMVL